MPRLSRDGAELHWEERGSGPLVVIVPHWFSMPEVFEPLTASLEGDHRVVRYDARGTGESTEGGPHDVATATADLHALVEELGGAAVAVGLLDASNVAIRAAAERPDLIASVVSVASFPATRKELEMTEGMLASATVVDTFAEMLEADYRGASRTVMGAGNAQMSEDEVRERVRALTEYCPHDAAVARLREYSCDDPLPFALKLGPRLRLVYSPQIAGEWFPPFDELRPVLERLVPEAGIDLVPDGIISGPEETAAIVREESSVPKAAR